MITAVVAQSRQALANADAQAMVAAVTTIVGLLSPPRAMPIEGDQGAAVTEAEGRWRSRQQYRLRRILLQLLGLHGDDGLDLNDHGTWTCLEIPFSRLGQWKSLASQTACRAQWHLLFQADALPLILEEPEKAAVTCGSRLKSLEARRRELQSLANTPEKPASVRRGNAEGCHQQPEGLIECKRTQKGWSEKERQQLLQAVERAKGTSEKLGMSEWREIGQQLGGRSADSVLKCYLKATDKRYQMVKATDRHKRGVVRSMVKDALQQLGGNATIPEIVEHCKNDIAIQLKYKPSLKNQPSKISGAMKELPLWVRSVSTNMAGFCRTTGEKRAGRKVYVLKQAV
mmetsp:Transcript_9495/g.16918  ORF Transcript_9495/g.16918 Transcript_9495/m.16918 type:complete len:343 (+) Transcript_9495:3-1031(+)